MPGSKAFRTALRIEAQSQRVAIVTADRTLGLPGRERPKRQPPGENRHFAAREGTRVTSQRRPFYDRNTTLDEFLETSVLLLHNCPNFSSQNSVDTGAGADARIVRK